MLLFWQTQTMSPDPETMLESVGPRLRELRRHREITLTELSEATGVSVSTLSRLESGQRKPTLELLLPLARCFGVSLDELVDAPATGDPRVRMRPIKQHGRTMIPLTTRPGGMRAFKQVIPGRKQPEPPELASHDGYEWLYVLDGRLRLLLGELDLVLSAGEAAEFDTRTPHAVVGADHEPVEVLCLFGPQGERVHVRARTRKR